MIRAPLAALLLAVCISGTAAAQSIAALAARAEADQEAASAQTASPGRAAAPLEAMLDVPVPAVTLYPGDALTPSALGTRAVPQALVDQGGIVARDDRLTGKVARRVLPAGQPIAINAITDATVVTKGVMTRVHLDAGGLSITGYAMPLESGTNGAVIRLKNVDSGQTIVGQVEPDGSVRIQMQ